MILFAISQTFAELKEEESSLLKERIHLEKVSLICGDIISIHISFIK